MVSWTDERALSQEVDSALDGCAKPDGYFWKIFCKQIIAELAGNVIGGCLPKENLHRRWPALCSANMLSVRWLTDLQNSVSVSPLDASPSASKASSSSGVPANPGTVRCSTAATAASTTSSTDSYAPRVMTA